MFATNTRRAEVLPVSDVQEGEGFQVRAVQAGAPHDVVFGDDAEPSCGEERRRAVFGVPESNVYEIRL